jgi:broad specificity phosphatase PhoE
VRFLLVRHGETTYNAEGRIQGQTDAPLSERGRWQAERIAERLRGYQFDACYASDLSRAADTARAIMRHHPETPFEFTTLLREIRFGVFEGKIAPEIAEAYPDEYALWMENRRGFTPPGAESIPELHERAGRALAWLREQGKETALVVAHGGIFVSFMAQVLNLDLEHRYRFHFDNTSLTVIEDGQWGPRLLLCNDASHLGDQAPFP